LDGESARERQGCGGETTPGFWLWSEGEGERKKIVHFWAGRHSKKINFKIKVEDKGGKAEFAG
jgi:hypothetical protein